MPVATKPAQPNAIGRGVWVAPWLGSNGETVLVAVNRRGWRIDWRPVFAGDDEDALSEELWRVLDLEDPVPDLKIVH